MILRPMKGAAVDDLGIVRFPCIGEPKIDGFRCVLADHPLTSRLSRFPNHHFHNSLKGLLPKGMILDGEVVVGKKHEKGVLQKTSSGLTSQAGEPKFRLWVFDAPLIVDKYGRRLKKAAELVEALKHPQIRILEHRLLFKRSDLDEYLAECLAKGYEGIVLRDPNGHYKQGKSTLREQGMLKIKPFETAEGRIKGWYEEMENTNEATRDATGKQKRSSAKAGKIGKGTLGGFILEDARTKVEVRVGGGFTAKQRQRLWDLLQRKPKKLLGVLVRYKKQLVGEKDKPRHPNFEEFVDFRPEWDMTDD